MERNDVERKMMDMGFHVGNKGFGYIADMLEIIEADGGCVEKITYAYAIVGKKRKQKWTGVERCIRHEIECYYNRVKVHPILENRWSIKKDFRTRNFLQDCIGLFIWDRRDKDEVEECEKDKAERGGSGTGYCERQIQEYYF